MQIMTRILAVSRALTLGRQLKEIERIIATLPLPARQQLAVLVLREMGQAGRCEFPHLYGTPAEQRYSPWGSGTEVGLSRARSDNPQVRMRGVALWLAVVFHETRHATQPATQSVHRHVLRVLRLLKEQMDQDAAPDAMQWQQSSAVA